MDVAPPWYSMSAETCSGEARHCAGGDTACRQQAQGDGYVAISTYALCRREEIHTIPRPAGAALLVSLLATVSVVLWRVRRGR